jgi:hypothetical protein
MKRRKEGSKGKKEGESKKERSNESKKKKERSAKFPDQVLRFSYISLSPVSRSKRLICLASSAADSAVSLHNLHISQHN